MSKRFECEHNWIIDNNKRKTKESLIVYDEEWNTLDDLCELLNQQDKRIKELEEELDDAKRDYIPKLEFGLQRANKMGRDTEKENQQLKQELKDERAELQQLYSHLEVEAFGEDIQEQAVKEIDKIKEENQQLKHAQKRLAIEELEKTLNNFKNRPTYFDVARQELCLSDQDKQFIDFINNQIEELKKEMK